MRVYRRGVRDSPFNAPLTDKAYRYKQRKQYMPLACTAPLMPSLRVAFGRASPAPAIKNTGLRSVFFYWLGSMFWNITFIPFSDDDVKKLKRLLEQS